MLSEDIPSVIYVDNGGKYVLLCTRVPYAEYVANISEMTGKSHLNLVKDSTDDNEIY